MFLCFVFFFFCSCLCFSCFCFFFFFNDTATTEIYTLSLHDALPISSRAFCPTSPTIKAPVPPRVRDRKSTRLNSSYANISYAVFCLKKKKKKQTNSQPKKTKKKNKHKQKQYI